MAIREMLTNADDTKFFTAMAMDYKDPNSILILSIVGGNLGIDRFMLGETGLGVAKMLTWGGCGIWLIIDWFTANKRAKDYNFIKLQQAMI
jgi:TM2 domain-containing membrane protein YozV